jgi:hypothetical protein
MWSWWILSTLSVLKVRSKLSDEIGGQASVSIVVSHFSDAYVRNKCDRMEDSEARDCLDGIAFR